MITITKDIIKKMKPENTLILLNTEPEQNPQYRMLLQTPNKLPAHDMGYDSITYNPDTIKSKIKQLEGQFIYDETQTAHNKRKTPENRGKRFAKITNTGYCPEYGGYADITVFDPTYHDLMKEAYQSVQDGLPLHEGPSTELNAIQAHTTDDNGLVVDDWDYLGVVWDNNHRDKATGVCNVLNSINDLLEEKTMDKEFKLTKEEYDELMQVKDDKQTLESELATLKAKGVQGKADWITFKQEYDDLLKEKNDLHAQLVPVWTKQGEQKVEMINSILETVPEKERDAKKADLEKLGTDELGIIVNSLPSPAAQQHGVIGGSGTGRNQNPELTDDEKEQEAAQKLPKKSKRNLV